MNVVMSDAIEILERTPSALETLLSGLSPAWTHQNEGPDTWSPFDVIGHLIHGDRTDWIPRLRIILSDQEPKVFTPFDRFAQFRESEGKSLVDLLAEFKSLRLANLAVLRSLDLSAQDLERKGMHPALGEVTLGNLLATWVAHDLDHISQIARVMAKQYKSAVGPWVEYLKILRS